MRVQGGFLMDPITLTIESIGEQYVKSLNRDNKKLHLVDLDETASPSQVPPGTIESDVEAWYAGFRACLQMVPNIVDDNRLRVLTSQLPPVDDITAWVTKNFVTKAKVA